MNAAVDYRTTLTENEVKISPQAHEKLLELVNSEEDINAVRIFVTGGGCSGMTYSMTFAEQATPFDSVLETDGLTVYVDAVALNYLEGVEIDYVQQGMGASFVFKNVFQATGGSGACSACGSAGGGCA